MWVTPLASVAVSASVPVAKVVGFGELNVMLPAGLVVSRVMLSDMVGETTPSFPLKRT